jgi:hypothetical protein
MATNYNPRIVTDGLVFALDAANTKSYDKYENLFTYSQKYDVVGTWVNQGSTSTINVSGTTAPDGTNTANKLVGNNGVTTRQSTYQGVSVTSGITYTFSVFLKQAERRYGCIWFDSPSITEGAYWGSSTYFDLQTGTIATGTQSKIVTYPNGWYRLYVTATPSFTGTLNLNTSIGTPNNASDGAGTIAYQYTGDGVSGFYIWGGQFEKGTAVNDYYSTTAIAKNRGTTLTNLVGSSGIGTLTNGPLFSNSNGGSIVFDGGDDYSISGALPGSFTSFTVIIWFYPTSVTNYENPIDCNYAYNGTTGNIGPRLEMNSSGTLAWNYSNDTASNSNFYTHIVVSSGLAANTWHCAAITYNGGTNTSTTYYNGNSTGLTRSLSGTPTGFIGVMNNVNLGRGFHLGGAERPFTGRVSNVQIYNRDLTASEIQQNFNATRARFSI